MLRKKWYISGAVSSDTDFRSKFAYAEYQLKHRLSGKIVNPVKGEKDGKEWDYYLRKDLRKLTKCTGIVLLHDWYLSDGAKLELYVAEKLGFEIWKFDCRSGELKEYTE